MYYICCFLYNQFLNKDQKSTGTLTSSEKVTIRLNLEIGHKDRYYNN